MRSTVRELPQAPDGTAIWLEKVGARRGIQMLRAQTLLSIDVIRSPSMLVPWETQSE